MKPFRPRTDSWRDIRAIVHTLLTREEGYLYDPLRRYHKKIPHDIAAWYAYALDSGHSIVCVMAKDPHLPVQPDIRDLVVLPVKTVLASEYAMVDGWPVVRVGRAYHQEGQLTVPEEDKETESAPWRRDHLVQIHTDHLYANQSIRVNYRWGDGVDYSTRINKNAVERIVGKSLDIDGTFRLVWGSSLDKDGSTVQAVNIEASHGHSGWVPIVEVVPTSFSSEKVTNGAYDYLNATIWEHEILTAIDAVLLRYYGLLVKNAQGKS